MKGCIRIEASSFPKSQTDSFSYKSDFKQLSPHLPLSESTLPATVVESLSCLLYWQCPSTEGVLLTVFLMAEAAGHSVTAEIHWGRQICVIPPTFLPSPVCDKGLSQWAELGVSWMSLRVNIFFTWCVLKVFFVQHWFSYLQKSHKYENIIQVGIWYNGRGVWYHKCFIVGNDILPHGRWFMTLASSAVKVGLGNLTCSNLRV